MDNDFMMGMEYIEPEPEIPAIYSITLTDGTTIRDLTLNGNNFISPIPIDYAIFDNNLSTVVIRNDQGLEEIHENMKFVLPYHPEGEYWFVLIDIPKNEVQMNKVRGDLEYLAMMIDVEL